LKKINNLKAILRSIFWITLLLTTITCFGQQFTISGVVKNSENGDPLPYATIKIKGTTKGTTTNIEGHFTLLKVEGDSVVLEASYIGFYIQEFPVLNNQSFLEINLTPHATQLDELVITAESYHIMNASEGLSYVKLSPKDLSLMPSLGEEDIFRSLQLMPGVSATNENSSGLYVRGGTPDQNLVTYDGMTVYHVDHFFGFFSAFNPDAIKDVQFYRGAFPAKYGGRTSGVIDLTGRTGSLEDVELDAGINLLSSRLTLNIPVKHKASILLSGRRSYSDFLESGLYNKIYDLIDSGSPGNPTLDQLDPDFTPTSHFYDINAKFTLRPTVNDNITLTYYNGKDFLDKSRDIKQIVGSAALGILRNLKIGISDVTNWGNKGISLRWARQWHPKFFSNVLVSTSKYFGNYDFDLNFNLTDYDTDSTLIHADVEAYERNRLKDFSYGLDNEWLLNEHHKLDFGFLVKDYHLHYNFVRDDTLTILNRSQSSKEAAIYLQDTWKIGSNFQLNAGVRGAYYDLLDDYFLEPRISAEYKFLKTWKLKAGWGQFNQFVNRVINENVTAGSRDFFLLSDDEVLGINKSTHYIFGGSFEKEDWLIDAEFFWKEMKGLSEFSLRFQRAEDIDITKLFFQGMGVSKGSEFLVQKKTGNYRAWISYTISRVDHTFLDLNDGKKFPALHDQSHELKTVHIYSVKEWDFGATFVYGSGKPYTRPESLYQVSLLDGRDLAYIHVGAKNGYRLPAYHRLDFSMHYNLKFEKSEVILGFSVFNLYNHKNVWYKEFDATDLPIRETNINYLGITPNVSLAFKL